MTASLQGQSFSMSKSNQSWDLVFANASKEMLDKYAKYNVLRPNIDFRIDKNVYAIARENILEKGC